MIPYTEISRSQIEQGWLNLWVCGQRKPALREQVTRRNFFPGYYLLVSLTAGGAPAGADPSILS